MQPRIYVYLITFVDQPYWYWGWHKEKKFDEYYMGSPVTNKKYWKLYEPIKEIVQVFDYSEEGETLARSFESQLIKPDLNNPFCLNEHCGGMVSSKVLSEAVRRKWQDPDYKRRVSETVSEGMRAKWQDQDYKMRVSEGRRAKWQDQDYKQASIERLRSLARTGRQAALSPSSRKKRSETFREIKHQKGERNSQHGTMWITDGTREGNRKIKKGDPVPEGFRPGRVLK